MMTLNRRILAGVLLALCGMFAGLSAQSPVSIPYMYSFEETGADAAENPEWVLDNPGLSGENDSADAWHMGKATFSDGLRSLYISCDRGLTPNYCRRRSMVVAYRKMLIPQGSYVFTFDWQNNASDNSGLYVCLVPDMGTPPKSDFTGSAVPQWVKNSKYTLATAQGTADCLKGALEWENASFQENFMQPTSVYLTFVWINDEKDSVPYPLAACIDNLQITSANCRRPSGLEIDAGCDTVMVSWEGSAEKYMLEYRENGGQRWRTVRDIRSKSYMITGLEEGVYDFRVRSVCNDSMYSAYETKNGQLLFCPENHCINYVDLAGNGVQCYVGTAGEDNFRTLPAPVDDGPNSQTSRHTVYWTRNQYDPRTNYKLKTIPDGEFASVRLGNWRSGGEAERIVYRYTVGGTAPVMLLKYAVVFELPDHEKHLQPYFDLTIFDEDGNVLGGDLLCGKAEFYAGFGDLGAWHNEEFGGTKISWKDWTTLGINLAGYEGQTVSIQLTTQDCPPQAHYAYAYFTLGCIDGTIESVSCGASEYMDIEAPEGFDYQWFTQYDADGAPLDVKGTERVHSVPSSDKTPYYCRCTFKENGGCYFDLSTVVSPREPFADFAWRQEAHDCGNWVRFTNLSHVTTVVDGSLVHTDEKTQTAYWDLGDGRTIEENDPLVRVKDEGDTLRVRLLAGISDDRCQDDTVIVIPVRSIITPVKTVDSVICHDDGAIIWGGQYIAESGTYYHSLKNYAGCDSIIILNATIRPEIEDTHLFDTICYGDSLVMGDMVYKTSGEHDIWLETEHGCDSLVILNLHVRDEVKFSFSYTDVEETPNSGSVTITDAPEDYTWYLKGPEGEGADMPLTGLAAGDYELTVYDSNGCPSVTEKFSVSQECLVIEMDTDSIYACADDAVVTIPYSIVSGIPGRYDIEYDTVAVSAGFGNFSDTLVTGGEIILSIPDACRPGHYAAEMVMEDALCGDSVIPFRFHINYPAGIVRQKWNNVFAVTNEQYNGGYRFSSFRWYKNGKLLPESSSSVYYLGENAGFDTSDVYHVVLTREDDGVTVATCPVVPVVRHDLLEYPAQTLVQAGRRLKIMNVRTPITVSLYDVSGVSYGRQTLDGDVTHVQMPPYPGIYIISIESGGQGRHYKIVVR